MRKFITIICFLLTGVFSNAQNPVSSINVTPSYPSASSEQLFSMDAETRAHVQTDLAVEVTLSSLVGIGKIVVKVGLVEGGSDLFYKEFDYGIEGSFEDNTSYNSNGNIVTLGLGQYSGYGTYYTEVFVIRGNGSAESTTRSLLN